MAPRDPLRDQPATWTDERPSGRKFVILAAPRTGSNLLCTLLNSHPDVLCHHELFNPSGIFFAQDQRDGEFDLGTTAERDRDPMQFLERAWQTGGTEACVGFKWTRGQNLTVLNSLLADPTVGKFVLRRKNRIKVYVSELIAQQTGQWEAYDQDELVRQRPRVRVALPDLQEHAATNEAFYASLEDRLNQHDQPWLDACYEDLFCDRQQQRLLSFLRVEAGHALQATSVKQNPRDLRQLIDNYDALAAAAAATEFAAELRDRTF